MSGYEHRLGYTAENLVPLTDRIEDNLIDTLQETHGGLHRPGDDDYNNDRSYSRTSDIGGARDNVGSGTGTGYTSYSSRTTDIGGSPSRTAGGGGYESSYSSTKTTSDIGGREPIGERLESTAVPRGAGYTSSYSSSSTRDIGDSPLSRYSSTIDSNRYIGDSPLSRYSSTTTTRDIGESPLGRYESSDTGMDRGGSTYSTSRTVQMGGDEPKGYNSSFTSRTSDIGRGEPQGGYNSSFTSRTSDIGGGEPQGGYNSSYTSRTSEIGRGEQQGYKSSFTSRTSDIGGSNDNKYVEFSPTRGGMESSYTSSMSNRSTTGRERPFSPARGGVESYSSHSYSSSRGGESPSHQSHSSSVRENPYRTSSTRTEHSSSEINGHSSPARNTGYSSQSTPRQASSQSTPERRNNRGDMAEYVRFVTITANVESIVNDPHSLNEWAENVAKEISEQKPNFACVNLQGLGSKNSKTPPSAFYNALMDNEDICKVLPFSKAYLDGEPSGDHTGLGSIFFIKDDEETQVWNGSNNSFSTIRGTSPNEVVDSLSRCNAVYAKGIFPKDTIPDKLFSKAQSQDMAPNGYMVFKWKLFDRVFTFVNVNLFATPCIPLQNIKEVQTKATLARQDQIQFLLQKLQEEDNVEARIWAGAFNTELDMEPMLKDLSYFHKAVSQNKEDASGNIEGVNYYDLDGKKLMTICENQFDLHGKHDWYFGLGRGCMARKYNKEIEKNTLKGVLHEHNTYFPPTCNFDWDKKNDKDTLNKSRLPAWADRIFYNEAASLMMKFDSFSSTGMYYGIVGANKDIGMHKPVAMHATICLKGRQFG